MTDDWGDLELAPKKSGVPKLLFCGAGCLLPFLLLMGALGWGWSTIERARDEDRQWAELARVLPYDERPADWQIVFGFQAGAMSWLLSDEVFVLEPAASSGPGGESATTFLLFCTDEDVAGFFDTAREEVEPYVPPQPPVSPGEEPAAPLAPLATLRVQGRDLPIALLQDGAPGGGLFGGGDRERGSSPAVVVDLTSPGAERSLVLVAFARGAEPMAPEEIVGFLRPFRIGPER